MEPMGGLVRLINVDEDEDVDMSGPPYDRDFVGLLHAGMYDDHPDIVDIWVDVMADPAAVKWLEDLDRVRHIVRGLRPGHEKPPPKRGL